jgi:hypothetical protein
MRCFNLPTAYALGDLFAQNLNRNVLRGLAIRVSDPADKTLPPDIRATENRSRPKRPFRCDGNVAIIGFLHPNRFRRANLLPATR